MLTSLYRWKEYAKRLDYLDDDKAGYLRVLREQSGRHGIDVSQGNLWRAMDQIYCDP